MNDPDLELEVIPGKLSFKIYKDYELNSNDSPTYTLQTELDGKEIWDRNISASQLVDRFSYYKDQAKNDEAAEYE